MNQSTKKIFLKTLLLNLIIMVFASTIHGQQITMSSINGLQNNVSQSNTLQFYSSNSCIDVQSGMAVLMSSSTNNDFEINCVIKNKFKALGVQLLPNVVRTNTYLKFTNPPPSNELFNIRIWNSEGILVKSLNQLGYQILHGVVLNLMSIPPGGYLLHIESPHYIEAIKFIKSN